MTVKELFEQKDKILNSRVFLQGWIRNHRKQKEFGFIDFSDGSYFEHVQIVYDEKLENFEDIQKRLVGCAIEVEGLVVNSINPKQDFEIRAEKIKVVGDCPEDYPIQPKRHSREFLREQAYLRPRTNLFQAVFRVRSVLAYAIHKYFQERDYVYVHAPLITASDCEGAGEMFHVTSFDLDKIPMKDGQIDFSQDMFGVHTGLTVSGQLEAESFALSFGKTYTFGPSFRAEHSNTRVHANEFWMIEPEIAFCDLEGVMEIMEDSFKNVVKYVLEHCPLELQFLDNFVEKGLIDKLTKLVNSKFNRVTHKEAIDILQKAPIKFEFEPKQGEDIAKEHEKYLTEYFNGPVFITDWPKDIKSFYMKQNPDGKTVAAVDLEVPGAGEIMGGSQREENYDKLVARMDELGMDKSTLDWYINLRKFGGCVHSGFGIGFERILIYLTGMDNIRDVIPFPRTPGNCDF